MLLRAIEGKDPPTSHVKIEPRLVVRESTRVREPQAAAATPSPARGRTRASR